jgi:hypothetical protein
MKGQVFVHFNVPKILVKILGYEIKYAKESGGFLFA